MRTIILVIAGAASAAVFATLFTILLQAAFEPNRTFGDRLGTVLSRQFGATGFESRPDPIDRYFGPFDSGPARAGVDRTLGDYDDDIRRRNARALDEFAMSFSLALMFFFLSFLLAWSIIRAVGDLLQWRAPPPPHADA